MITLLNNHIARKAALAAFFVLILEKEIELFFISQKGKL